MAGLFCTALPLPSHKIPENHQACGTDKHKEKPEVGSRRSKITERPKTAVEATAAHRLTDALGALVAFDKQGPGYLADGPVTMPIGTIAIAADAESDPQAREFARDNEKVAIGQHGDVHDQSRHVQGPRRLERFRQGCGS